MRPKLTPAKIKQLISYWTTTAAHDYDTLLVLFKNKKYSNALFFGHIVLEKILKAHVVKTTNEQAPYTHDLIRLRHLAKLPLVKKEINLLIKVNDFNIRSRYPDFKYNFYKKCTKSYTEKYYKPINELYQKICHEPKLKE